jgi:hypothetical protein
MGREPTQGDENSFCSANYSPWKHHSPLCHLDRSAAQWRDLRFSGLFVEMFFDRGVMGREPTQGDENSFCSATTLPGSTTLPFVIPTGAKRSGGACGSAVSSWKCFSTEESWAVSAPKVMKNSFCSATSLPGSTTLPFVISTEAKRSGEIRGSAVSSWKCFSTEESWAVSPPKVMKNSFCSATTLPGSTTLPFVISTEAKRSGEISVWMLFLGNVFRQQPSHHWP